MHESVLLRLPLPQNLRSTPQIGAPLNVEAQCYSVTFRILV
jgi:hypothetical protein